MDSAVAAVLSELVSVFIFKEGKMVLKAFFGRKDVFALM